MRDGKEKFLCRIRKEYGAILQDALVGIYLHGSLAFGCYDPRVSDIDFLVVVDRPLSVSVKKALLEALLALLPLCPRKGPEMSVILARHCRPFVYPTPYELHFSMAHHARALRDPDEYCTNFHGTDKDLAAHITVTRAVGQVLCGKPIFDVFGEVPREAYLDSICYDVENAAADIFDNPVYIILNLCRVAAYIRDGLVISKKDGGLWGMAHLPCVYHGIIHSALDAYGSGTAYVSDTETEIGFAAYMTDQIFHKEEKE